MKAKGIPMQEEFIGKKVLDAAFKVHTVLGPGLLESVYEAALALELAERGLDVERQREIPAVYNGHSLGLGFRADLIVQKAVLVELKSVETLLPVHKKITNTYLRLIPLRLGYLINFNEAHLKNGIIRVVNGTEGKPFWSTDLHQEPTRSPEA
jgi:GxxExxY protein